MTTSNREWRPAPELVGKFYYPAKHFSIPAESLCWWVPPSPNADFRCVKPAGHIGKHALEWSPTIKDYSHLRQSSREVG